MTGEPPGTGEPIVYIDHSTIHDDRVEDLKSAIHRDSASLELHLEVGKEQFRKLGEMITLREIQVYGTIGDRAREMLEQKAEMLGGSVMVTERLAGFARPPYANSDPGAPTDETPRNARSAVD